VAVMLSQHLRGCRNPPPLMDQSLHTSRSMDYSTNKLIPDPIAWAFVRLCHIGSGISSRLSVYPCYKSCIKYNAWLSYCQV